MAYSISKQPPRANTEGGALPPQGTTGRYLWEDTKAWATTDLLDEPVYPGQLFCVRESLSLTIQVYDASLIAVDKNHYVDNLALGNWQSLTRSTRQVVLESGLCRQQSTLIERDNWFGAGYKLEDGATDYGRLKISQCNFSLEPSTPISIEIAGVEIELASYEVPAGRGTLLQGTTSIDRAYLRTGRAITLRLGKVGIFINQGAALTNVGYSVRQVNNCPGDNRPFNTPLCPKL